MILTENGKELAMELLCAMTVEDIAVETGRDVEDVYKEFRSSNTFEMIFNEETGLWMNGPTYIMEEYDHEIHRDYLK